MGGTAWSLALMTYNKGQWKGFSISRSTTSGTIALSFSIDDVFPVSFLDFRLYSPLAQDCAQTLKEQELHMIVVHGAYMWVCV